jgi:dihydrolipoamide dehydrogenase
MAQAIDDFDVVVIGAGPGGYVCAIRASQLGLKVACVEKNQTLGGTCLNVGCIPSKALLESSHLFHQAQHKFAVHGIISAPPRIDVATMQKRKSGVVQGITKGVEFLFRKNRVTWVQGNARFKSTRQIAVKEASGEERILNAKNVVIASGSRPRALGLAPFDHEVVIDSTDALALDKVPQHLLVVGGGVIGLELGSVWQRLGAEVTVIEALEGILPSFDRTIVKEMHKQLTKQGINILVGAKVKSIAVKKGKATLAIEQKGKDISLDGDKVLLAVGRVACSDNLGLDAIDIKYDAQQLISVDAHLQTAVPGVYAIGDVVAGPMLAHKAEEEGIAVAEFIATGYGHVNYRAIPSVVYTWPEIAALGLSEQEAEAKGIAVAVGTFDFKANARAKAMGEDVGMVKVIADKRSDALLGVHIIGPYASELIGEAVIAFEFGASAEDLARAVHSHPTLGEALKEAALAVDKRAIHS